MCSVFSGLPKVFEQQIGYLKLIYLSHKRRFWGRQGDMSPPIFSHGLVPRLVSMLVRLYGLSFRDQVVHCLPQVEMKPTPTAVMVWIHHCPGETIYVGCLNVQNDYMQKCMFTHSLHVLVYSMDHCRPALNMNMSLQARQSGLSSWCYVNSVRSCLN